ncbi:MAG: hypothetical protein QOC73_2139 [Actinomycetota bacterium]|jgi:hypothetical protein|nr:hypothetical protein [Actinomycetota bacterium]MDQ1496530.1 hypothetical protein [Actinomycetota bacterium]
MNDTAPAGRRPQLSVPARETAPAGNVSVIVAELSAVRCRWCNDDLEHCHDSLVMHAIGGSHCISASCVVPDVAHHMVVRCDDVGCTCTLVPTGVAETA